MESDLERIIRSKQKLTDQHFQYFMYQVIYCTTTIFPVRNMHTTHPVVSPQILTTYYEYLTDSPWFEVYSLSQCVAQRSQTQ